ncbi:SDR family oxidoreductase [Peribacillus cavernae]|uniref:SDR family oxidoreductase n=1 Tax=Peribacillus cavernae TaxID=1674310 RepID=A0A433HC06_9BACI|nr:SDR family NAD(P)-dependent oxidoreductase [Peribacillus cavernae]MDQ0221398.1 3-oxoacyl-[acyl-carrier protein] reductase [Peribacillus cavernae]RUQ25792.1 SDR family oxidoreductase [Peribacillus cavernae]
MKLKGKVAIITGASPLYGMGNGFAAAFAKEGANLSLNYFGHDKADIEMFKSELESYGVKVILTEGDISKETTVKQLVNKTIDIFGQIDILVNNANISSLALIQDMTVEQWDRMIEVNLKSVFLTTRNVVPYMISRKSGRIINMASQIGQKGGLEHSHYAAAKAGIIGFTKSIALELGQYGITANCIAPGPIDTQEMQKIDENWRNKKRAELAIPRFGKVEEVVPTAVLLASDPDGNIYTGQSLGPNSGDVML